MKASGNAAPETCVQNLLKTIRGEAPYERDLVALVAQTGDFELRASIDNNTL